jgi:hypothetical protein
MKKFLVIYSSSVSATDQMSKASPDQAKAGMDAWMAWAKKAGPAIVDFGTPVGNAANVVKGDVAKTDSKVGGFSILQAESAKALAALLKEHPHFHAPGGTIEIHEYLPLPGM